MLIPNEEYLLTFWEGSLSSMCAMQIRRETSRNSFQNLWPRILQKPVNAPWLKCVGSLCLGFSEESLACVWARNRCRPQPSWVTKNCQRLGCRFASQNRLNPPHFSFGRCSGRHWLRPLWFQFVKHNFWLCLEVSGSGAEWPQLTLISHGENVTNLQGLGAICRGKKTNGWNYLAVPVHQGFTYTVLATPICPTPIRQWLD